MSSTGSVVREEGQEEGDMHIGASPELPQIPAKHDYDHEGVGMPMGNYYVQGSVFLHSIPVGPSLEYTVLDNPP